MFGWQQENSDSRVQKEAPQAHWASAATLALGLTIGLVLLLPARAAVQRTTHEGLPATGATPAQLPVTRRVAPLRDGVYLYGNAAAPEQHKSTYFVFEVRNQQVVGAVYSPKSSYDCFYGSVQANSLDVRVFDAYEASFFSQAVNLGDYYALPQVSRRDQQFLQTCRASAPTPAQLQAGKQGVR